MSMCHRSAYKLHVKVPQRSNDRKCLIWTCFLTRLTGPKQQRYAEPACQGAPDPLLWPPGALIPRTGQAHRVASPRPDPRNGFGEDLETARAMAQLAISVQTEADLTAADAPPSEPAGLNISRRDR